MFIALETWILSCNVLFFVLIAEACQMAGPDRCWLTVTNDSCGHRSGSPGTSLSETSQDSRQPATWVCSARFSPLALPNAGILRPGPAPAGQPGGWVGRRLDGGPSAAGSRRCVRIPCVGPRVSGDSQLQALASSGSAGDSRVSCVPPFLGGRSKHILLALCLQYLCLGLKVDGSRHHFAQFDQIITSHHSPCYQSCFVLQIYRDR
jgi:hypothetical protein